MPAEEEVLKIGKKLEKMIASKTTVSISLVFAVFVKFRVSALFSCCLEDRNWTVCSTLSQKYNMRSMKKQNDAVCGSC